MKRNAILEFGKDVLKNTPITSWVALGVAIIALLVRLL